jgi:hypothetical protein
VTVPPRRVPPGRTMLVAYLAGMGPARQALWCYLIWYLATVILHFDPSPQLWLSSLGTSMLVGVALLLSVGGKPWAPGSRWQTVRLFMMPFCVSSYAALIKGQDYLLVFPGRPRELALAVGACAAFLLLAALVRRFAPRPA